METEIWKDVIGFEGLYQCSSEGRIKSLDRIVKNHHNSTKLIKGRIKKLYTKAPYITISLGKEGKYYYNSMHRIIYESFYGKTEKHIDHINNDRHDNRICNLQALSVNDNINKSRLNMNRTSKYPGVHYRGRNKWRACIMVNRKLYNLGSFVNEELASIAYNEAKQLLIKY